MDSSSVLALLLTLFLALCSALAFVLLYLRGPWQSAGGLLQAGGVNGPHHAHAHGAKSASATHRAPTAASSHAHAHADMSVGALAHALGPAAQTAPPAPSPAQPALTADLALRGRKAKKRGGRVHVTVGAGGGGAGVGGVSAGGGRSSRAASTHAPYVYPLDFLSAAPPVIVCLTTIPSRVHHIDKCLNSIKTQNYPIAQMMLAIPEESRREHTKYSIPDRVRKDAIISVVRVSHDYGPATSLITAWSAIPAGAATRDTLIIALDDDQVYHPDTVATLVRHALHHPDEAVGFAGYSLRGRPFTQSNLSYAPTRREERPDLSWRATQHALAQQIASAAVQAQATTGVTSSALAAAAAASYGGAATDLSLLPPFDPLPDCTPDADPYAAPLPNPNDVYETEPVDVLCAWRGGVCVRKRFIDERLWQDYAQVPSEAAYWASDEWLSSQLAKNGVARRVILAPFDPVLGRLRLRHGRNSASASHLAYQQTILEFAFDRDATTTPNAAHEKDHVLTTSRATTNVRQLRAHSAELFAPTPADLERLRHLIRPYQPPAPVQPATDDAEPVQETDATAAAAALPSPSEEG